MHVRGLVEQRAGRVLAQVLRSSAGWRRAEAKLFAEIRGDARSTIAGDARLVSSSRLLLRARREAPTCRA